MNSILSNQQKEDFLIRIYFHTSNDFHLAGINRAFLDFARTLKVVAKNRQELKQNAKKYLLENLNTCLSTQFSNQEEFDKYHEKWCLGLQNTWSELSIGQCQKWINMTLKYWLLFGNSRINNVERNAMYFHIPLDRYVQQGMFSQKTPKPWSQISDYQDYLEYQFEHRRKKTGNAPIVDEFEFFNGTRPKL